MSNQRHEDDAYEGGEPFLAKPQQQWHDSSSTAFDRHEFVDRLEPELRHEPYHGLDPRNQKIDNNQRNSAYDSLLMMPLDDRGAGATPDSDEKRPKDSGAQRQNFRSWMWEIGACFLSLASIASVIAVLSVENNKPLDQWAWSIGPTAVVAFITALAKSSMLLAITEVLSQLKWQHFYGKTNPLIDLQIFDTASRGPLGATAFLWAKHVRSLLASLAAIIIIMSLLVDPFMQLVFTFPARPIQDPSASASLSQTQIYDPNGYTLDAHLTGYSASSVNTQMQAAIIRSVSGQPQAPATVCTTGNCTLPPVTTLGVCADCTDITRQVNISCPGRTTENRGQYQCDYGMPSGQNISAFVFRAGASGDFFPTRWNSSATSLVNPSTRDAGEVAPLAYVEAIQIKGSSDSRTGDLTPLLQQPTAWKCSFDLCAKTYQGLSVTNGVLTAPRPVENLMLLTNDTTNITAPIGDGLWGLSFLQGLRVNTSSSPGATYRINQADQANLADYLTEIFSTGWGERGFGASNRVQQATAPNLGWAFSETEDMSGTVRNIAESMTEIMRNSRNSTQVAGEAFRTQVFIEVQWGWIALPLALTALSLFLVVVIIMKAYSNDLPIWKSSTIALLSHEVDGWAPKGDARRDLSTLEKEAKGISITLPKGSQDLVFAKG